MESIIKETKNDDLVQEKERELRSANLIVYGIKEEPINAKEHDEKFVSSFLDTIGVSVRPKQIIRRGGGIPNDANKRLVKVVMNNKDDKEAVMARLGNLRNAEEIYVT